MAQVCIKLENKEFNVDLASLDAWCKANCGDKYVAPQSSHTMEIWFSEDPGQDVADALAAKWASIEADSIEATSYKSREDIDADKVAKRASAKAKLLALGLSEDEAAAILG